MISAPTGRLGTRGSGLGLLALGAAGIDILRPAREFSATARSLAFDSQDRPIALAASPRGLIFLAAPQ